LNREVANNNCILSFDNDNCIFFFSRRHQLSINSLLFVINKRARNARAAFQKSKVYETVIDRFRCQTSALSSCKASISRKRCRGM